MPPHLSLSYVLLASVALVSPLLSLPAPAGMMSALDAAEAPLAFVEECLDRHSGWGLDGQYEMRDRRQQSLIFEIHNIWGPLEATPLEDVRNGRRPCQRSAVKDALRKIDTILADVTVQLAIAAAPLRRGAWIGSLALCRDSVRNADFGIEKFSSQVSLSIRMTENARSLLAQITERRVGRSIAIRVDGQVISTPGINERIEDGVVEISGPDRAQLERVRVAAAQLC